IPKFVAFWGATFRTSQSRTLVPTFRSSCSIAASTFTNFGKSWALANLLILVPLCRSEVPDRIRRLWRRDFGSAVLVGAVGLFPHAVELERRLRRYRLQPEEVGEGDVELLPRRAV